LVWATNNKHDNMVRLLLEHGASTSAQTAKGHTIVDFLRHDPNDNTKIVQIFQEPGRRDSISSNGSLVRTNNSSLGDDLFYQAGIEGFEEMMAENERRYRMAMDSANAFEVDMADLSLADQVRDILSPSFQSMGDVRKGRALFFIGRDGTQEEKNWANDTVQHWQVLGARLSLCSSVC